MKIVFVCGSIEPGRDGVGDYTRRLAANLTFAGHEAIIVAFNDRHITHLCKGSQKLDGVVLSVLRIPSSMKTELRVKSAKEWIEEHKPHWISLQYVPYSFQRKGVPFGLAGNLKAIGTNLRWHVMFHELWLDETRDLKQRLFCLLQKYLIYKLIGQLRPTVVNVSIPFNQDRLKTIGVYSEVLYLFGNIGKTENNPSFDANKDSTKRILYFGSPPRDRYLDQLVNKLEEVCGCTNSVVKIEIVSGHTSQTKLFVAALNEALSKFKVSVMDHGFLETDALSKLMSSSSVGICRSKPYLLGKSGSAIAMLEHGLPIWLPKWNTGDVLDYDFRTDLIYSDLHEALNSPKTHSYVPLLPKVTEKFIHYLNNT